MNNIHYASIRNLDISNGEGIGVALFVQGCHFHCYNCFNTETWDFNGGKEWTQDTEDKLIELANKPYIKRLSILGGEPLADENLDGVLHLVDRFRLSLPNKSIWLYTGYKWNQIFNDGVYLTKDCAGWKCREIVNQCNILVDGKYIDSLRDPQLHFRGSSNQRVIDIQKSIQKGELTLWCQ